MIAGGGVAINRTKVDGINDIFNTSNLIKSKYLVAQKGKKNYFLIVATKA